MTDFERIKAYYSVFDEQGRLDRPEGKLEFDICMELMKQYISITDNVLDLGGGAGKYSIELAKLGYSVTLADLSERLIEQAKTTISQNNLPQLKRVDVVNAIDLSCYKDNSFDCIILFGPLYHLLESTEREKCISEVKRVLKPNGIVFASFIPYLTGAVGVVSRALYFPDQVNVENLSAVFDTGKFSNNIDRGFQEGYYPTSHEIEQIFNKYDFTKMLIRSIRGFGYNKEEKLYELKDRDKELFDKLIQLINDTALNPALIETGGHALYIGRKHAL